MDQQSDTVMKGQLFDNLRGLINIVDQLRDVGVSDYIKLPRIAVLGTQSAGKSSLLENIVGLDFLPRGEGVVTRRPLEMRLIHRPDVEKPWAYFGENKEKKFTDFDLVREEIIRQTDEIAGANKGIVNKPIILTIFSSDCPDLTIIDLPGITKVPLRGSDQKQDIEKITKEMASSYCEDERTVILCVMPANQDLTTSDALQMAQRMDKEGKRTLGVITKIDIMDRGTDARKVLLNQEVELKLGYVGVKNRSQLDINQKMRVTLALNAEKEYFAKHPVYSSINQDCLGTSSLVKKLTTILFNNIRECLPQIIKEIDQKIKDCEARQKELGPSLPRDNKERMHLIWNLLTEYTENFRNQIRGKYDHKLQNSKGKSDEANGGAKIKMILNALYEKQGKPNFKITKDYSTDYIVKSIELHQGDSIPGFPSFDSFLYLIIPQLEKLREPATESLDEVFTFMESLSNNILKKVFLRFPSILDEISEISSRVLQDQRDKTKQIVENIIDAELGYIFTNDPEYLTSRASIVPLQTVEDSQQPEEEKKDGPPPAQTAGKDKSLFPNQQPQQSANTQQQQSSIVQQPQNKQQNKQQPVEKVQDPKKLLAAELRQRVDSYYSIVVRNLRDQIPKSIGFFMVRCTQDQMQYQLYSEIMKNQQVMNLLDEPEYIAQERETIAKTIQVLKNAQRVLKKDPELQQKESTSKFDQFKNAVTGLFKK